LAWQNALASALAARAVKESLIAHPLNKVTSAVRAVRAGIKMSLQLTTKSIKMFQWKQF
jgi:hypothetical protein